MDESSPDLTIPDCRTRQRRLITALELLDVDCGVFVSRENVQYLTGFRPHRLMACACFIDVEGRCVLAAPNAVLENVAADEVVTFEAQWLATLRQEQPQASAAVLAKAWSLPSSTRVAVEYSHAGPHLSGALNLDPDRLVDIEPLIWRLRRQKEADELAVIRKAIACTEAMYRRAREVIEPGITELGVFRELESAAVAEAGKPLTALGNDYQCNSPGGPPRQRVAQDGELFILDLGPAYRGYYADNCRTFCVGGEPSDAQTRAWEAVVAVLQTVEETVRPGVSCRTLYEQAKERLDRHIDGGFFHHLGHGFGLFPHEAPHLNPNWDDVFEEGDVFTAEPGLYAPELRAGIRLEENYRVTEDGIERLTSFPLELS